MLILILEEVYGVIRPFAPVIALVAFVLLILEGISYVS